MRDILWLRWFAVAAALTNIPYFLSQSDILWPPVLWALAFTVINLYQILRIYLERRPVVLSEDEQKLYDMGFRSLRPREFVSLVVRGRNCLLGFRTVSLDSFVVMPNHLHGIIHGRGAIYCAQFCAIHCVWFKRDWRCAFDLALHAYLWCAVSDFVILRSNAGFT